jgi:alpha-L-rhamnosidase
MLGHAEEWFYRGLAGIDFDLTRPADERIHIKPAPVGDVRSASVSFQSVLGTVESRWSRDGDTLRMDITVPPNATATITFPAEYNGSVTEGGKPMTVGNGIRSLHRDKQHLNGVIGSGVYHFEAKH